MRGATITPRAGRLPLAASISSRKVPEPHRWGKATRCGTSYPVISAGPCLPIANREVMHTTRTARGAECLKSDKSL